MDDKKDKFGCIWQKRGDAWHVFCGGWGLHSKQCLYVAHLLL